VARAALPRLAADQGHVSVFVGIDIGTSGAKALAVNERGEVTGRASTEYGVASPRPGWTEQAPATWWEAARETLGQIAAGVRRDDIRAIGLTGQMHGSVFLDGDHTVIRPALLWNDQRTQAQCVEITELVGAGRLLELTGNPALTGFQAPKILWLREQEPASFARVAKVLLPKDYVRLQLTGEFGTDASDASGTLLLDLRRRTWSAEILQALDLPPEWLPPVHESPETVGTLRSEVARELGLPPGIPVAAGAGDNAAAAVGTGIVKEGMLSSSIGTSGVLFAATEEFRPDPSGRLHAFCHALPGRYHLMGVTLSAGESLSWWRGVLGKEAGFAALEALASEAPPGADGLLFLPYLRGERTPVLDPQARGGFFGLTARHSRSHLTRAIMEGVVLSLRDSLELMRGMGLRVDDVRATGGGARSELWVQMQADNFESPIGRMEVDEGPAYGACLLAGVAAGGYDSVEEAVSVVRMRGERVQPDGQRARFYSRLHQLYGSAYPATRELMTQLSQLSGD
jgi:xylulokinase